MTPPRSAGFISLLAVVVGLAVGGCGAAGHGAGARPAEGRTVAAVRRRCSVSQFRVHLRQVRTGAPGQGEVLTLVNQGPTPCRLAGVPEGALVARDGRVVFPLPEVGADHRLPVELAAGRAASVWLVLLAPNGLTVPRAVALRFDVHGIRGPIDVRVPGSGLSGEQVIVSAVAPGSVRTLPTSTGLAARCRRVAVLKGRAIGESAGHFVVAIVVRNNGRSTCSLGGYPSLSVDTINDKLRYRIPEDHAGPSALINLAPGQVASAAEIEPDCTAFGVREPPLALARASTVIPHVGTIIGPPSMQGAYWPTRRCVVTVTALTEGQWVMGPGYSCSGDLACPRPVADSRASARASARQPTAVRDCRTSQLTVRMGHSEAGLGTTGADIEFIDRSSRTCDLHGWPTLVAHRAAHGSTRARDWPAAGFAGFAADVRHPPREPTIVIKPHHRADAIFAAADGPGRKPCGKPYRTLAVTPPGDSQSVSISAWIPYLGRFLPSCSKIILSPVLPSADLYKG